MVRFELSYQIHIPLIHINGMSYEKFKGFSNNRHVSNKQNPSPKATNSTPKAWVISYQGLPNTWALVNCSTNTCQSDTGWFITLKLQGPESSITWASLSPLHRRSRGCMKNIPMVRIKMAPQPSSLSDPITETWKYFIWILLILFDIM